jgi:hypothetical protein
MSEAPRTMAIGEVPPGRRDFAELQPLGPRTMRSSFLAALNRDGCGVVRGAVDTELCAELRERAELHLAGIGANTQRVYTRSGAPPWSGHLVDNLDRIRLEADVVESDCAIDDRLNSFDSTSGLARSVCGSSGRWLKRTHVLCSFPDEAAFVSPPHQDHFDDASSPTT